MQEEFCFYLSCPTCSGRPSVTPVSSLEPPRPKHKILNVKWRAKTGPTGLTEPPTAHPHVPKKSWWKTSASNWSTASPARFFDLLEPRIAPYATTAWSASIITARGWATAWANETTDISTFSYSLWPYIASSFSLVQWHISSFSPDRVTRLMGLLLRPSNSRQQVSLSA